MVTMDFKTEFLELAHTNIHRDGVESLLKWIQETDFFTAPASTKFHGVKEGGLVEHSLNVYSQLVKLSQLYGVTNKESITIVSLFHDLCKIACYKQEMRWRKNSANQWEQYPIYVFKEDFAYGGHGSKSVYLVQNFMPLTPNEATAINCHMGQWEATQYGNPTEVYCRNKLAWLLHVADEAADFIVEQEGDSSV